MQAVVPQQAPRCTVSKSGTPPASALINQHWQETTHGRCHVVWNVVLAHLWLNFRQQQLMTTSMDCTDCAYKTGSSELRHLSSTAHDHNAIDYQCVMSDVQMCVCTTACSRWELSDKKVCRPMLCQIRQLLHDLRLVILAKITNDLKQLPWVLASIGLSVLPLCLLALRVFQVTLQHTDNLRSHTVGCL